MSPDDHTTTCTLAVRCDDLDQNGHVRGGAYLAYADHARWLQVQAAGVSLERLAAAGLGPVNLETTVRFSRELLLGDEVTIVSESEWTDGRTSLARQRLLVDGSLAAEVSSVCGLLDLTTRRLVHDPQSRWRAMTSKPAILGL